MYRCRHCNALLGDSDLIRIMEDPSPAGLSLPYGHELYTYCPYCGHDRIDEFELADAVDIEALDDMSISVTLGGKGVILTLSEGGDLVIAGKQTGRNEPARTKVRSKAGRSMFEEAW